MNQTKAEFLSMMLRLRSHYQNAITDEGLWRASVDTYWNEMKHYSTEKLQLAFNEAWRKHNQWMPSCGQITEIIEGNIRAKAVNAWMEFKRLARRSRDDHSDPIAAKAMQLMGGGKKLGAMDEEKLEVWGRKQFEEYYQIVSEQPKHNDNQITDGRVSGFLDSVKVKHVDD